MREFDIAKKLYKYIRHNSMFCVNNYYLEKLYQCDLIQVTNYGYLTEYEIKTSYKDFQKDAKKHNKHRKISNGDLCNMFYYVIPESINIPPNIVDEHNYGIITYNNKLEFKTEKKARLIHNTIVDNELITDVLKSFYNKAKEKYYE